MTLYNYSVILLTCSGPVNFLVFFEEILLWFCLRGLYCPHLKNCCGVSNMRWSTCLNYREFGVQFSFYLFLEKMM